MNTQNDLIGKRIRAGRVERLADELDAAHERAVRAARNEAPAPLPGTQTADTLSVT